MGRRPTPGNPTPGEGNPQLRLRLAPALHAQVAAQGNEWAASVLQAAIPFPDMPQDEAGWLRLWAGDPDLAERLTLRLAVHLEDALPQLGGALSAAWSVRRDPAGCKRMAHAARNAKSAAPTKGAALEMPGLTGGQRVELEDLARTPRARFSEYLKSLPVDEANAIYGWFWSLVGHDGFEAVDELDSAWAAAGFIGTPDAALPNEWQVTDVDFAPNGAVVRAGWTHPKWSLLHAPPA